MLVCQLSPARLSKMETTSSPTIISYHRHPPPSTHLHQYHHQHHHDQPTSPRTVQADPVDTLRRCHIVGLFEALHVPMSTDIFLTSGHVSDHILIIRVEYPCPIPMYMKDTLNLTWWILCHTGVKKYTRNGPSMLSRWGLDAILLLFLHRSCVHHIVLKSNV